MVRIKMTNEIIASVRLYRILHKPTGLYYKPGYVNLSQKGKVYTKKPSLKHCLQHGTAGAHWLGVGENLKPIMAAKAIPIKWEPCRLYIEVKESDLEIIEIKYKKNGKFERQFRILPHSRLDIIRSCNCCSWSNVHG